MILVTGATGTIGQQVVAQLAGRGEQVRALVRTPERGAALQARGAETAIGDFARPESLRAALGGVDRAFLLSPSGSDQAELETAFVDAARDAGVRHIVKLSVLGADAASPCRLIRSHARVEAAIEASGLPYTFVRPNSFMQNLRSNAGSIASEGAFYLPAADARISYVDARDVAAVAVRALTGDEHAGKTYDVTGPQALSCDEIAGLLSARLGRTVRYVPAPDEVARQGMVAAGLPEWYADGLIELYQLYRRQEAAVVTDTVERVTGQKSRTLGAYFDENIGMFKGG